MNLSLRNSLLLFISGFSFFTHAQSQTLDLLCATPNVETVIKIDLSEKRVFRDGWYTLQPVASADAVWINQITEWSEFEIKWTSETVDKKSAKHTGTLNRVTGNYRGTFYMMSTGYKEDYSGVCTKIEGKKF